MRVYLIVKKYPAKKLRQKFVFSMEKSESESTIDFISNFKGHWFSGEINIQRAAKMRH